MTDGKIMVTLSATCEGCGLHKQMEVPRGAVEAYNAGALMQEAFPMLSDADRELFVGSHLCDACWQALWGPESAFQQVIFNY